MTLKLGDIELHKLEGALMRAYRVELESALHDPDRLAAVYGSEFATAPVRQRLQTVVDLAAAMLRTPIASVQVITATQAIIVAAHGMEPAVVAVDDSYCSNVIGLGEDLAIEEAIGHALVCTSAFAIEGGIRAYLGVPLVNRDGHIVGTLCVCDHEPRAWHRNDVTLLAQLAAVIAAFTDL